MDSLVIVPTYNERDNLVPLAQRVLALPVPVDMLVVDDNSPDGTGQLADKLAQEHPQIHVLHRPGKSGLGRAYCAGFTWALDAQLRVHPGDGWRLVPQPRRHSGFYRSCPNGGPGSGLALL